MTSTLTIKTDAKLKEDAKAYFSSLGINLSGAINLFLRDAVQNQRLTISLQESHGTLHPLSPEQLSPSQLEQLDPNKDRSDYVTYTPSS